MSARIPIDREAIAAFCRRHCIRRMALFGSVLRDDFRPDSDVDVLVEFEPEHVPGYIRLGGIERELRPLLGGRRLDLITFKGLSPYIRDEVLAAAETLYGEG